MSVASGFYTDRDDRLSGHPPTRISSQSERRPSTPARAGDGLRAYGNAGRWKAWKSEPRISTLPPVLGNRCAIPTFPQARLILLYSSKDSEPTSEKCHLCPRAEVLPMSSAAPAQGHGEVWTVFTFRTLDLRLAISSQRVYHGARPPQNRERVVGTVGPLDFGQRRRNANEEFHTEKRVAWRRYRHVREPRHQLCACAIVPDGAARGGDRRARPSIGDWRARQTDSEAHGEDHQNVPYATGMAQCDRHRPRQEERFLGSGTTS